METTKAGAVEDADEVVDLLIGAWGLLVGSDETSMEPSKLVGRVEHLHWNPPELSFQIERHGGTVQGSTRAELHLWSVDIEKLTAKVKMAGRRQLRPQASSYRVADAKRDAARISRVVEIGDECAFLVWKSSEIFRVKPNEIVPSDANAQATQQARCKRLRGEVVTALAAIGWEETSAWRFKRSVDASAGK